ncbi:alpha/beta fold hydrolase [Sulfitobacter sp. D35]|uniref:alpha/beta fold hydrolase n=1 Tax=Sulfitobacter sp. D35 TaxID=3083252 RepID=UPI00296EAB89|nr:alpha/beta fold hydrolase [Sulfitobacter sp. D35]MDW4499327.1 alpha/beta fold hydrolase [Sulfitobacter sp. D35]
MTTIILIPGFMCTAALFGPQIPLLERFGPVQVVVPTQATIADMAAGILRGTEGLLAVAGLSMGGIVALEMLRQAPERIQRLALMDTTPLADAPANHDIRTGQIAEVHAGGLRRVMREELKPAYLVDSPDKPALLDLCMDMAESLGPDVFEAQALALRDRADARDVLRDAPAQTLILCGAEDRLCPPDRHDLMHELAPQSVRETIPDAGHLPTLENPEATNAALSRWLEDR